MIAHKITTGLIGLITGVLVLFSPGNAQAPTETPQVVTAYLPPTTTTTTMPALVTTCTQVASLALAEGLPPSELETALRVAVRESRCTSDAYNALDTNGGSYGLYQINGFWCRWLLLGITPVGYHGVQASNARTALPRQHVKRGNPTYVRPDTKRVTTPPNRTNQPNRRNMQARTHTVQT